MQFLEKQRIIEIIGFMISEPRRNYIILKPNYHPKFFSKDFISYTNEIKNQEYYRSTSLFRSVNIRNQ